MLNKLNWDHHRVIEMDQTCPLMALSRQSSCGRICPLSHNSGHQWILTRDGLSVMTHLGHRPASHVAVAKQVSAPIKARVRADTMPSLKARVETAGFSRGSERYSGMACGGTGAAADSAQSSTARPGASGNPKGVPPSYVAFFGPPRELGYVEGGTFAIEYINFEGHLERYDEAMRDRSGAASISSTCCCQEENLRAAIDATSAIPIVMLAIGYLLCANRSPELMIVP
jgi:hypothetical protein